MPTKAPAPIRLPAEFWDRADVTDALTARDIGDLFRLLRQYAQVTQLQIERATGIPQPEVSRIQRKLRRVITHDLLTQVADGLHMPNHARTRLGLAPILDSKSSVITSTASSHTVRPHVAEPSSQLQQTDRGDPVQRRTVLLGGVAVGTLALVGPQKSWLSAGRRISLDDVRDLTARTARQRRLDDFLGGADTYQIYASELNETISLYNRASYTEHVGGALLSLVAEQAQQAGWAAFDAGENAEAKHLFNLSLIAAEGAGARSLVASAYAYMGYQQVSTERTGVDAAVRSCEVVDPAAPPAVRALMFERRAWAHAVANEPTETERALSRAHEVLEDRAQDQSPDWAAWVDHAELDIMTGRCWTQLHRPLRAVPVLEKVLSNFDDSHARDKALYLTWLAEAFLDANEVEQAAATLTRALSLSDGVASIRPRQRIDALVQRLLPHRKISAVADLVALGAA